ncbi:MAG TPA: rod shape-determining protein MreC [Pyrinomonadaceae bacterium]|nr:rod shape-determining protein MreC [Chloracidobacterium sp.]MBP9935075.1 rod shape-determining protein MreC [Pyrinomonadaceae bacterium]MBL0241274.1 rod shape-determining protein MreC [Chloracidobacterium sp.]HQX55705.1 rod shape-determining protein MreC [Pyrinomonadaceae bacterium]HQY66672.1 rod shape-determining protein MreC [Pyrinomonadaceae bacterium]
MVERSQKEVWRLTPWLMIALLLLNFILMAFDAKEITTGQRVVRTWTQTAADFVQSPVTTVSSSISNYFISISSLRSAQSENDLLKQRVQELEVEVKQKSDLSSENERLKSLLQLKETSKYKVLTARIIGRDPSVWFDSSIINRGSLDGVMLNMAVVTDGGLVGRVTAVGPLTSQVDLITYNKTGVGGIIGEVGTSSALGVVSGTSKKDLLEMKFVPGSVEVQVGQPVFTTGQDGIFPPGLKIGEIISVVTGSATTPHQIQIQPAAKLNSMQEVGVLLYEAPQKPEFEQKLPNAVKKK